MNIIFTPTAWEQYTEWQREDKKIVKRINELIKSIDREGLAQGIGKPEPLKYRKVWSRRIANIIMKSRTMEKNATYRKYRPKGEP